MTRKADWMGLKELYDFNEGATKILEKVEALESYGQHKIAVETIYPIEYNAVLGLIELGLYRMDPELNSTKRPWSSTTFDEFGKELHGHIWILTSEEEEPEDIIEVIDLKDPTLWVDVQQLHPRKDENRIQELKDQGYRYSGKWKDLVELTKYEDKTPALPEGLSLEQLREVTGGTVSDEILTKTFNQCIEFGIPTDQILEMFKASHELKETLDVKNKLPKNCLRLECMGYSFDSEGDEICDYFYTQNPCPAGIPDEIRWPKEGDE